MLLFIQIRLQFHPHLDRRDEDGPPIHWHLFQGGTPALQYLRITGIGLPLCFSTPQNFTGISTLELHGGHINFCADTYSDFLFLLNGLSSLIRLTVNDAIFNFTALNDQNDPGFTHLPNLRELRVRAFDLAYILPSLLYLISGPALEILLIENVRPNEIIKYLALTAGVPKFPSLHSLVLLGSTKSWHNFQEIPKAFPDITHLTFSDDEHHGMLESVRHALSTGEDSIPWPDLHTVTIVNCFNSGSFNFVKLKSILSSRPIRKLRLSRRTLSEFSVDERQWFQDHVEVEEDTTYADIEESRDSEFIEW